MAVERRKDIRNSLGYHNMSYLPQRVYVPRRDRLAFTKDIRFETKDGNTQKGTQNERF